MVKKIYRKLIFVQVCMCAVAVVGVIIDTSLVGNFYGVNSLAAVGLVAPLENIIFVIASIFGLGVQVVCSISIGKLDNRKASSQLTSGLLFSIAIAFVCIFIIYTFLDNILIAAGAEFDTDVYLKAKEYTRGVLPTYITGCLGACLMYLLQINGKQNLCIASIIIYVVSIVGLDLLNIFVIKMDLFGMGLATAISDYICVAFLMVAYFFSKTSIRIKFSLFNIKHFKEIFTSGFISSVFAIYNALLILLINNIVMQNIGSDAVASITVIFSLSGILWSVSLGISFCTNIVSGLMYGERNIVELKSVVRIFVKLSIILNSIIVVFVMVFGDYFIMFYMNPNEPIFDLTVSSLKVFAISIIPYSIGSSFKNWFNSTNNKTLSILFTTFSNFIFILLIALLLVNKFSIVGIFIGYIFGPVIGIVLLSIYCCIKNKSMPFSALTYLIVPKGFAIENKYICEDNIQNEHELQDYLNKLEKFCRRVDKNSSKYKYISLVVEELGNNIIKYGMKGENNKYNFKVRVYYDSSLWTICLRDDCEKFNPKEFFIMRDRQKNFNQFGLKIVFNIALNVKYNYVVSYNNILLTI